MAELIDRQAAIEKAITVPIARILQEDEVIYRKVVFVNDLEKLPAIQPAQQWIPCSERLPRECGFYLCATKDCITILEFTNGNPHYNDKPSFVDDVLGRCNSYVTAWMPLPEPPKHGTGGSTDKQREATPWQSDS